LKLLVCSKILEETSDLEKKDKLKVIIDEICDKIQVNFGENPFDEMKGNVLAFDPYNKKELIKKIGLAEYIRKYENDELYPEF